MSLPPTPPTSWGSGSVCLSTPTSAGSGRADGGARKFICRPATDGGSVLRVFFPQGLNPQSGGYFAGYG
jgi:hypothetical protein